MEECRLCKGLGSIDKIYTCHKCDGTGKSDWVTNAMHKPEPPRTALRLINIKQLLKQVEDIVFNGFITESLSTRGVVERIKKYLFDAKSNHVIAEWRVVSDETNFHQIDVYVQPTRMVEFVKVNFRIDKNGVKL